MQMHKTTITKYVFFTLISFVFCLPIHGQRKVKLRNIEQAPGANYTPVTGVDGKLTYQVLNLSTADVNLTPINYVPSISGNSSNLNQIVTDPNSDVWFIDSTGDAVKLESSESGISANADSTRLVQDSILVYFQLGAEIGRDTINLSGISQSGSLAFDSNRPILRELTIGTVIGGTTITDVLNHMYFSPPSLSLSKSPSTSTYEVGTSTVITLSTSTSNAGGSTLSNGILRKTSGISQDISTFGANTSHDFDITFTPQQGGAGSYNELEYRFRAYQDWTGGGSSGTAQSMETTIRAVYPVLYGMASTDTSAVLSSLYASLANKVVTQETDVTVSYTGSGLIYYAFPQTWNDTNLSQILDSNGFDVTASFTRVDYPTVTSSGLTNNYNNQAYVVYFLNTGSTTTSASQYQFIR